MPNAVSAAALQQRRRGIKHCPHGPRANNLGLQNYRWVNAVRSMGRHLAKYAFPLTKTGQKLFYFSLIATVQTPLLC